MRDLPDNVIPFPRVSVADKIHDAISQVFDEGEKFTRELTLLLEKYGFAKSYIEAMVPDMLEAYMNDDATPLWLWPNYKPPGTDDV